MHRPLILLLAMLAAGCQSRGAALTMVCNAPMECEACRTADPTTRATLLAQHISDRLSNREVQEMFASLATADPAARVTMLQDAVRAEGITTCPMLDEWAQTDW